MMYPIVSFYLGTSAIKENPRAINSGLIGFDGPKS